MTTPCAYPLTSQDILNQFGGAYPLTSGRCLGIGAGVPSAYPLTSGDLLCKPTGPALPVLRQYVIYWFDMTATGTQYRCSKDAAAYIDSTGKTQSSTSPVGSSMGNYHVDTIIAAINQNTVRVPSPKKGNTAPGDITIGLNFWFRATANINGSLPSNFYLIAAFNNQANTGNYELRVLYHNNGGTPSVSIYSYYKINGTIALLATCPITLNAWQNIAIHMGVYDVNQATERWRAVIWKNNVLIQDGSGGASPTTFGGELFLQSAIGQVTGSIQTANTINIDSFAIGLDNLASDVTTRTALYNGGAGRTYAETA